MEKRGIDKFFTSEGKVAVGFSGIGKFRGRTNYNDVEQVVLQHFFTNSQSNVYCATDNLPDELWALLMGQYARSDTTVRDRLLKLFDDVHEKEKDAPSIADLAVKIRRNEDMTSSLDAHLKRAGKFIDEFGVQYGHASLRDSGRIRICFEGVSQRATKFLESAREGAYQEQSTRATPFTAENLGIPFEIQDTPYETKMLELDRKLIALYESIRQRLPPHLKEKYAFLRTEAEEQIAAELGVEKKLPEKLWDKIVNEKTFDVARSLLPQNITTSLGVTLNNRRFQDQLTEWQSLPFLEMQALGRAAQLEAMKISPTLMKYGGPSEFFRNLPQKHRNLFAEFVSSGNFSIPYANYPPVSTLVDHTSNIEDLVLASILLQGSDGHVSLKSLQSIVSKLNPKQRENIARSELEGRELHDILPKSMEIGTLTFERIYDIGAYRDLQRQRGDRQQTNPYAVVGYNMPPQLVEIGLAEEFTKLMVEVRNFYGELRNEGMHATAEYAPVMANLIRHIATKDPVQCFYEAKLRAQPAGADSYRAIARQEIKQTLAVMPAFKGIIEFDDNEYPLNRLPETVKGYIRNEKAKAKKV